MVVVSQPLQASFLLRPVNTVPTPSIARSHHWRRCRRRQPHPQQHPQQHLQPQQPPSRPPPGFYRGYAPCPSSSSSASSSSPPVVQLFFTQRELEALPVRPLDFDDEDYSIAGSDNDNDEGDDDGADEDVVAVAAAAPVPAAAAVAENKDGDRDHQDSACRQVRSSDNNSDPTSPATDDAVKGHSAALPHFRNEVEEQRDDDSHVQLQGKQRHHPQQHQPAPEHHAMDRKRRRHLVSPPPLSSPAARAAQAAQQQLQRHQPERPSLQPKPIPRTTVLPWNKVLVESNAPDWMVQQVSRHASLSQTTNTTYANTLVSSPDIPDPVSAHPIELPAAFEPPVDAHYWKRRCFHWQSICQASRKRIREMEEDQRQLRRRIWELEEQVVWTSAARSSRRLCRRENVAVVAVADGEDDNMGGGERDESAAAAVAASGAVGRGGQGQAVDTFAAAPAAARGKMLPISPPSDKEAKTKKQQQHCQQQDQHPQPPKWIVTVKPRKCSFYLTDCEGLSDSGDYHDDCDDNNDNCQDYSWGAAAADDDESEGSDCDHGKENAEKLKKATTGQGVIEKHQEQVTGSTTTHLANSPAATDTSRGQAMEVEKVALPGQEQ